MLFVIIFCLLSIVLYSVLSAYEYCPSFPHLCLLLPFLRFPPFLPLSVTFVFLAALPLFSLHFLSPPIFPFPALTPLVSPLLSTSPSIHDLQITLLPQRHTCSFFPLYFCSSSLPPFVSLLDISLFSPFSWLRSFFYHSPIYYPLLILPCVEPSLSFFPSLLLLPTPLSS